MTSTPQKIVICYCGSDIILQRSRQPASGMIWNDNCQLGRVARSKKKGSTIHTQPLKYHLRAAFSMLTTHCGEIGKSVGQASHIMLHWYDVHGLSEIGFCLYVWLHHALRQPSSSKHPELGKTKILIYSYDLARLITWSHHSLAR